MQLPPASVLATWPTPNYVDPVTRGNAVLIVNVTLLSLAFIVTVLRLYTRFRITCTPGLDDFLIVCALIFAIGMCVVTSMATINWGWTRHIWDVPLTWLPNVSKYNLAFQLCFSICSSITKLSVLWFCKRLVGTGSKGLYWGYNIVLIIAMVIVLICCLLFVFISIFQCTPIHAFWDLDPQYPHTCLNDGAAVFSASVVNVFTDFLSTVVPMPLIWNLKLPVRQRIAVISIFALGILVNVAGSVRTVYVWKSMIASYDATWEGWPILLAASIEISLGLICASAPALRPLVAFFLPRLLRTTRRYSSAYGPRSRDQKLWTSTGPSKQSNFKAEDRMYDCEGLTNQDRLEVMRTVEMETFSESRRPSNVAGNVSNVVSNHARVATPTHNIDLKNHGVVYTSPGSDASSTSLTREANVGPSYHDHRNFI
ncbi:integral membrane protein [Aspergillus heteromorphus CBS 117.55]|uniref:Integral membrane protein n=1 Tax=Aspergillus heteromorphus CBS 117.55 TaxID=1448321 RepID=A0A317V874_9EURO|nr:uncharacterized protein BO70DRAFT_343824 [Aspergillus heteromorphus CBS 117.55]PWY70255.1 integral membrane protein [Aspergillus heteromorphus CBS 117.55]